MNVTAPTNATTQRHSLARRLAARGASVLAVAGIAIGAAAGSASAAVNLGGVTFQTDNAYCNGSGISVYAENNSSTGAYFQLVLRYASGSADITGPWHAFNGGPGGFGTTFGLADFNFGGHASYRVWVRYAQLLRNGQYAYGIEEIVRFNQARPYPYSGSTVTRYCTV